MSLELKKIESDFTGVQELNARTKNSLNRAWTLAIGKERMIGPKGIIWDEIIHLMKLLREYFDFIAGYHDLRVKVQANIDEICQETMEKVEMAAAPILFLNSTPTSKLATLEYSTRLDVMFVEHVLNKKSALLLLKRNVI